MGRDGPVHRHSRSSLGFWPSAPRQEAERRAGSSGGGFGVPLELPFWTMRGPLQPRLVDDLDVVNSIYIKWVIFGTRVL